MVAAAAVTAMATGRMTWRRTTARMVSRLLEGPPRSTASSAEAAAPLPAPVARYLAFALPTASAPIRSAHIRWTGKFRMRPGAGWKPFEAQQHFTAWPLGGGPPE